MGGRERRPDADHVGWRDRNVRRFRDCARRPDRDGIADSELDADGIADRVADGEPNTQPLPDPDIQSDGVTDADSEPDGVADPARECGTECRPDRDPGGERYADRDRDADRNPDSDPGADSETDPDTHAEADSCAQRDAVRRAATSIGTSWQLASFTTRDPAAGADVPAADRPKYTISFASGGTFSATADCNVVTGEWTATAAGGLSIVPDPSTIVPCAEGSYGDLYVLALTNSASYSMANGGLTIALEDGGTLVYQPPS